MPPPRLHPELPLACSARNVSSASLANSAHHPADPEDASGREGDAGYDLKDHRGKMQCRCAAENERHCEGYRCYDQYTRERNIGHHKSILCGVCCLDVASAMPVHLDKHLMLVPDRLTMATT